MTFEPPDPSLQRRPPRPRPQLYRRDVLRGGLWLTVGIGAAPLLAACGGDSTVAASGDYPLARPNDPVKLPISDSNQPIADGVEPETGGEFRILNYDQYMAPSVMRDFEDKHGVEVQVTPYNNYDEMLTKITASGSSFDLVFPGPTVMSQMVFNELLQPFNKSYIPNFKNTWAEYRDPWYDLEAQYSAPYTVYTTGIGYRTDRGVDPSEGYKMLWNSDYIDHAGLLDDSGESLGMAMLAWDITTDINTGDLDLINQARDKLIELIDLVHIKTGVSAYAKVPNGDFTVSQCWSGDMIAGASPYYLNKGDTAEVLGYWVPESSAERVIGNDCICIPKSASKPVLAHLLINDLLDNDIAYQNFDWNGYQPPLTHLNANYLINVKKRIPQNLLSAVVVPKDFDQGYTFYEVSPEVQNEWLAAYQEFEAGG